MRGNKKQLEQIQNGIGLFTKIFMKYDALQKKPVAIGNGVYLNAAHMHLIEAIGKDYGKSVTALSSYFRVTKGAISQVVTKLHHDGYLLKTKNKKNDKNIILELTEKGWNAFRYHENFNEPVIKDLLKIRGKYTEFEFSAFLHIMTDIDLFFSKFIAEDKTKTEIS